MTWEERCQFASEFLLIPTVGQKVGGRGVCGYSGRPRAGNLGGEEESEVPGRESRRSNRKGRGLLRTAPPLEAFHKVPEFPVSHWVNALAGAPFW